MDRAFSPLASRWPCTLGVAQGWDGTGRWPSGILVLISGVASCGREPEPRHVWDGLGPHRTPALTVRPISAWAIGPGIETKTRQRAEGPIYHPPRSSDTDDATEDGNRVRHTRCSSVVWAVSAHPRSLSKQTIRGSAKMRTADVLELRE